MSDFWEQHAEAILIELEDQGYLFSELKLSRTEQGLKLLGRGGFSCVYEMAVEDDPNVTFALKVSGFGERQVNSEKFRNATRIQWLLGAETEYILRVFDIRELLVAVDEDGHVTDVKELSAEWSEETPGYCYLQMVLMEKLDSVIERKRGGNVELTRSILATERETLLFGLEIADALETAHVNGCLHRDVKLENTFWDPVEGRYKLGDFGLAKQMEEGSEGTIVFSDGYGAPEINCLHYKYYDAKAEIYSLGICLYLLLNDLKFPGSEGYYSKMEIQYREDFIFPPLEGASPEMINTIRRMCSYHAKDRYQSMKEVITDLVGIAETYYLHGQEEDEELADLTETVTMTVQNETETAAYTQTATQTENGTQTAAGMPAESEEDDEEDELLSITEPKTREERKEEQRVMDAIYRQDSITYWLILTPLVTLLLHAMHPFATMPEGWYWYVVPVALLFEALLQRLKELHLFFGILLLGAVAFSVISHGFFFVHIIWIICILLGIPTLTAAGAFASGFWILLAQTEKLQFLDKLHQWDFGWCLLAIVLIVVYLYLQVRLTWEKTTYLRAWLGIVIYRYMFIVMAIVGIVLWFRQKNAVTPLPEVVSRLHLVRTAVACYVAMGVIWWKEEGQQELESGDDK